MEGSILERQAQHRIGLGGQHGCEATAQLLTLQGQIGLPLQGHRQVGAGPGAAQVEAAGARELHRLAALQQQITAQPALLEARRAQHQVAIEVLQPQCHGPGGHGQAQILRLQAPAVVGAAGPAGIQAQQRPTLQVSAGQGEIQRVEAHLQHGRACCQHRWLQAAPCGQGQAEGTAAAPVQHWPVLVEAAVQAQLAVVELHIPRQVELRQGAAGGEPATAGAAAGQHATEVEALQLDAQAAGSEAGAEVAAPKAQLVHGDAAAIGQAEHLTVHRFQIQITAETQIGADRGGGLAPQP